MRTALSLLLRDIYGGAFRYPNQPMDIEYTHSRTTLDALAANGTLHLSSPPSSPCPNILVALRPSLLRPAQSRKHRSIINPTLQLTLPFLLPRLHHPTPYIPLAHGPLTVVTRPTVTTNNQ